MSTEPLELTDNHESDSAGQATESSVEKDEHGLSFGRWVDLFLEHSILASKAKSATANNSRKSARETISKKINNEFPLLERSMTGEKVRKAFNNKKSRTLAKSDSNKTGNNPVTLSADEERFMDFLLGPDGCNPSVVKVPGAVETLSSSTAMSSATDPTNDESRARHVSALITSKRRLPFPSSESHVAKKARYDSLYVDVMAEQLKYFKKQNEVFDSLIARVTMLENRIQELESLLVIDYSNDTTSITQSSSESIIDSLDC